MTTKTGVGVLGLTLLGLAGCRTSSTDQTITELRDSLATESVSDGTVGGEPITDFWLERIARLAEEPASDSDGATPVLAEAASHHPAAAVRVAALRELLRRTDGARSTRQWVEEPLVRALEDRHLAVRFVAVEPGLERVGAKLLPRYAELVGPSEPPELRVAALKGLARYDGDVGDAVTAAVFAAKQSDEPGVRFHAGRLLDRWEGRVPPSVPAEPSPRGER